MGPLNLQLKVPAVLSPLTPPSLRALCSSGSLAVGHQASAIRHLSVTEGLQRFSTIWTALHFCTRTFHWGSTATARISSCCRKASVCDITWSIREVRVGGDAKCCRRTDLAISPEGCSPLIMWMFGAFIDTHRSDVFDSGLKSLQYLLSLSGALWVGKCLRVEAARGWI